jgi:hypothetical protein
MAAAVPLSASLLLAAACNTIAPSATPTAAPSKPAATAPTKPAASAPAPAASGGGAAAAPAGAAGDLAAMTSAWASARSYRLKVVGTRNGTPMEIKQEVVRPDFDRVEVQMGQDRREVVRIGRTTYMWANGMWRKFPDPAPNPYLVDPAEIIDDFGSATKGNRGLVKGSTAAVDGTQCQEWTLPPSSISGGGTLCVGLSDNLPRRLVASDQSMTFTFSDWNGNIAIEAPPVA